MEPLEAIRRRVFYLFGGTAGVAAAFVALVLGGIGPGVLVHEVAGVVLLLLVLACLDAGFRIRRVDTRPLGRAAIALVALLLAGTTGAGLALGALGQVLDGLPLLPIAVLLLALIDGAWIARTIGATDLPGGPGA